MGFHSYGNSEFVYTEFVRGLVAGGIEVLGEVDDEGIREPAE
jgi:hypothetical protein